MKVFDALRRALRTVSEAEARSLGCTHEGLCYGLPVWVAHIDNAQAAPLVVAKWAPVDSLLPAWIAVGLVLSTVFSDAPRDEYALDVRPIRGVAQ